MADAAHVEFESPAGLTFGLYEDFPLHGGPIVGCLVLQPESGDAPTRVKFDSPEADKLCERFPELADVKAPEAAA